MDPILNKGDILVWIPTKIEEIDIDDIVVFKSYIKWPNEKIIAHRVADIKLDKSSGELVLETKGDSNDWKDQESPYIKIPYIHKENIQGKVVCFSNQPIKININYLVVLSLIIIFIYIYFLYHNRSKCNCYR